MHNTISCNFSLSDVVYENQSIVNEINKQIMDYTFIDVKLNIKNVKKFYESNHNWIFKIEKISGIIFKMPANTESDIRLFENRCQNIELSKDLCKKLSLNLITIPESYKVNENLLVERKLKFIKNNEELDKIYSQKKFENL